MKDDAQVSRPIVDAARAATTAQTRPACLGVSGWGVVAAFNAASYRATWVGCEVVGPAGPDHHGGLPPRSWPDTPPQVEIAGLTVQLQGFTSNEPASVIVFGRDGHYITLLVVPSDVSDEVARQELDAASQPANGRVALNDEAGLAAAQSLIEVAAQLARHEGRDDVQRAAEIKRWCEEAAQQFSSAPIQAFVPLLVGHIVRNRMDAPRPAAAS